MIPHVTTPIEPGRFFAGDQPWHKCPDAQLVALTDALSKAEITNMEVTYGK